MVSETPDGVLVNGELLDRAVNLRNRPITCETYLCGGVVIKIDMGVEYHSQPEWEAELWERIEPQDRRFFTEVLAYGTFEDGRDWIIKKYYPLKYEGRVPKEKYLKFLAPLVDKYDIRDIDEEWNCAINAETGLPIIFDWGM